jgi:hypothetical protein
VNAADFARMADSAKNPNFRCRWTGPPADRKHRPAESRTAPSEDNSKRLNGIDDIKCVASGKGPLAVWLINRLGLGRDMATAIRANSRILRDGEVGRLRLDGAAK